MPLPHQPKCQCGASFAHATVHPIRCSCGRVYDGPSRGLGDTIAKTIKVATGGKVKPCKRCTKRQAWANRIWPYGSR